MNTVQIYFEIAAMAAVVIGVVVHIATFGFRSRQSFGADGWIFVAALGFSGIAAVYREAGSVSWSSIAFYVLLLIVIYRMLSVFRAIGAFDK